jgi:hypothetical protein
VSLLAAAIGRPVSGRHGGDAAAGMPGVPLTGAGLVRRPRDSVGAATLVSPIAYEGLYPWRLSRSPLACPSYLDQKIIMDHQLPGHL